MLAGSGERRGRRTAAGLGQRGQAQERVVAGHGLECDVAVPGLLAALLAAAAVQRQPATVQLLGLLRADHADLVVLVAVLARRVADRVDVQL